MINWKNPKYYLVRTEKGLLQLADLIRTNIENKVPIAIDTESTGAIPSSALNPFYGWLLGISMSFGDENGYYIPIKHTKNGILVDEQLDLKYIVNVLDPILSSGGVYLMHNAKHDYKFLWQSGIHIYPALWDTMLAVRMLNGDSRKPSALKKIIGQYVNLPPDKEVQLFDEASGGNAAEADIVKFSTYAIDDSLYTYLLYKAIKPVIDARYKELFYNAELPLIPILSHMELRGIKIDVDYFKRIRIPLCKVQAKIEQKFLDVQNVNVASPIQVRELLEKYMVKTNTRLALPLTPKKDIKTDVEALQVVRRSTDNRHPLNKLAKHILFYRAISKAISTYIDKFPKICRVVYSGDKIEHILHTDFDQIKNSGRLSSSPNIQNITRDSSTLSIRQGFCARDGYKFVEADWSGCELRIVAIASQDEKMISAYKNNPRGADLHEETATAIGVTRHIGKTLNFSIIYGATKFSISKTLNCPKDQAAEYLNMFYQVYPGVKDWKNFVEQYIIQNGFTETFYGRRRYLPDGMSPSMFERWKWEGAVRELVNHIIQGTSADLLKFSMVKIARQLAINKYDAYLETTTHDSIVVEAKENIVDEVAEMMRGIMEVSIRGVLLPVDIAIKRTLAKG